MYLVYLLILILGIEWFYNHPALRYGGYHIIALLLFIPISVKLGSSQIDLKKYSKISIVLVSLTIIIFLSRNINRIDNEVELIAINQSGKLTIFLMIIILEYKKKWIN